MSSSSYEIGMRSLSTDIRDGKQIALFLGAGVNVSENIKLGWNELLNPLLKYSLYRFSAEHGLSKVQLKAILDLFEVEDFPDFKKESGYNKIREKVLLEFGSPIRAMLVKSLPFLLNLITKFKY